MEKVSKKQISGSPVDDKSPVIGIAWATQTSFLSVHGLREDARMVCFVDGHSTCCDECDLFDDSVDPIDDNVLIEFVKEWNVAVITSSNACKLELIGLPDGGDIKKPWFHLGLDEDKTQCTFGPDDASSGEARPLGMAIDFTSVQPIDLKNDGDPVPPSPRVLVLVDTGHIEIFDLYHTKHDNFSATDDAMALLKSTPGDERRYTFTRILKKLPAPRQLQSTLPPDAPLSSLMQQPVSSRNRNGPLASVTQVKEAPEQPKQQSVVQLLPISGQQLLYGAPSQDIQQSPSNIRTTLIKPSSTITKASQKFR